MPADSKLLILIIAFIPAFLAGKFSESRAEPPAPEQVIMEMVDAISMDSLLRHIQILEDAGGTRSRISFTPGKDSAAVYIKKVFDRMPGLSSVWLDTFYVETADPPYNTQPLVNVVATLEGSRNPGAYYVIGGHYDSTTNRDTAWAEGANWKTIEAPGADDNATGVAAVLEIARVLSDPEFGFQPDYTLVFVAFGAEESIPRTIGSGSHTGSAHFAARASSNDDDIRGMISIDMIGYNNYYDYTALVIHDNFMADESEQLAWKLVDANTNFDIGLIMNDAVEPGEPPFARAGYSDHDSFANQGYPAVLVVENAPPWESNQYYEANPHYHKTTDTWDKLNMQLVRKVTQLNLATIASFGDYSTGSDRDHDSVPRPGEFVLHGNYPNPFNPATHIVFELPQSTYVELSVYDMTGRKIDILVSETLSAGRHTVLFDAAARGRNLPSGLFLYRLSGGSNSQTGKMILIK